MKAPPGEYGLWVYTRLEPSEVTGLRSSVADRLGRSIQQAIFESGRDLTVAVAHVERGILLHGVVRDRPANEADLLSAARKELERLLDDQYRALMAVSGGLDPAGSPEISPFPDER